MLKHKTIAEYPEWVPVEDRRSRFGGAMPPRKPERRRPMIWLAREDNEVFLVNATDETFDYVIASSAGFQTVDDDVMNISSENGYEYHDVHPNQAIKVEEYDVHYDLDFVLPIQVHLKSKSLGCLEIRSPAEKGGIGETVLLWNSGEPGKNVYIKKRNDA